MRNPVNRLATAAPRALDSILFKSSTTSDTSKSTPTAELKSSCNNINNKKKNTKNVDKSVSEGRGRGSSFHIMDLSLLLNLDDNDGGASVGCETTEAGSVLTSFEEMMMDHWDWSGAAASGGDSSSSSWDELNKKIVKKGGGGEECSEDFVMRN